MTLVDNSASWLHRGIHGGQLADCDKIKQEGISGLAGSVTYGGHNSNGCCSVEDSLRRAQGALFIETTGGGEPSCWSKAGTSTDTESVDVSEALRGLLTGLSSLVESHRIEGSQPVAAPTFGVHSTGPMARTSTLVESPSDGEIGLLLAAGSKRARESFNGSCPDLASLQNLAPEKPAGGSGREGMRRTVSAGALSGGRPVLLFHIPAIFVFILRQSVFRVYLALPVL
jgi:hypothetical protein